MSQDQKRSRSWIWCVCVLMMIATVINYMDRMTLNLLAEQVQAEFSLNNQQYGRFELGFGLAFAAGSLFFGSLIDRVGVYWIYPLVLAGWSTVGFLSGLSQSNGQLFVLRTLLGFFESAHFPCALKAVQILMTVRERPVANSLLQSGSALGAILAPQAIKLLLSDAPEGWRRPFLIIGAGGGIWVFFWLLALRPRDLPVSGGVSESEPRTQRSGVSGQHALTSSFLNVILSAKFLALLIMVLCINLTWQFFRVWLPKFLCNSRGYSETEMLDFITFYYLAAFAGSLLVGALSGWLAHRMSPYAVQASIFAGCSVLTSLTAAAACLPAQPLLLGMLLLVAAGSLGVFTGFYSLTQMLSLRHQGKVSGLLSTFTWVTTAALHPLFGAYLDRTRDYDLAVGLAGCLPMISCVALVMLWNRGSAKDRLQ